MPDSGAALESELALWAQEPGRSSIALFHGDGRVRQAALKQLDQELLHPLIVYGLISRLNDWAPEVRAEAKLALVRCFSKTPSDILFPAVWIVLQYGTSWKRWSGGWGAFLQLVNSRETLFNGIAEKVRLDRSGEASRVFRNICQSPLLDAHLELLAEKASQPHIRASALRFAVHGEVTWWNGEFERQWIDKSLGKSVRRRVMVKRPIANQPNWYAMVERSLRDDSAAVRNEVLDALILLRHEDRCSQLIEMVLGSCWPKVAYSTKSRMEFLRSKVQL
ncbi:hypothetical protein [Shimia sp. Alg240-R146]|uniref:hypothetical protein n=1 Tax=Shimia sp. Alg240-R146 TaxID=2993449 RepID=UPI0022E8B908|nr:hypothetical protein [Shimia sp. Alg240-R146]